ncbi:MAG: D-tyrosyl-tRNA(Tyr) deacylase [Spirochaetales bacterium]|nr:D-tyrosyl-tRNA(Tyr) deacylase [Spirochaetales bacterium]
MRAVVQRVRDASVTVDGAVTGKISFGLLVYLGVVDSDNEDLCRKMAAKISKMRLFRDSDDKMNLSVADIGGDILVVSQFTLYANLHKGNRPSFDGAGKPEHAERMYELFMQELRNLGFNVQHGIFGAHMHVCYENDGPVTIIADSDDLFGLK